MGTQDKSYGKAKESYDKSQRNNELLDDIRKVKEGLRVAKTFEATLAFKKLQEKLEHERRII